MAWNPSVNDMTPQILMQGAQMWQNAGANMQNGINHVFDEYKRKQEENKDIAAKGNAAVKFLQSYGKELGLGEEELKQFTTQSPDETGRQFAIRVASGLKDVMTMPEIRKAQAAIQASNAQADYHKAEAAKLASELKSRDEAVARVKAASQFAQGVGNGVYRPDVQDKMRLEYQNNPYLQEQIRQYAVTGELATPKELMQFVGSQQKPVAEMKPVNVHETVNGVPVIATYDAYTKKRLGEAPTQRLYPTPEEKAKETELVETAKNQSNSASAFLKDISDAAESARYTNSDLRAVSGALKNNLVQTGVAEPLVTKAKQIAVATGFLDEKNINNQEAVKTALKNYVVRQMRELNKAQGAVNTYERQMFESALANPSLTPGALNILIDAAIATNDRAIKLQDEAMKLRDAGVDEKTIHRRLEKMRAETPIPGIQLLGQSAAQPLNVTSVKRK